MYTKAILPLCLLVSTVLALPSFRRQDTAKHVSMSLTKTLLKKESDLTARSVKATLHNQVYAYTIDMTVGTPAQHLTLQLDTGSSDIWSYAPNAIGACDGCTAIHYNPSASSTASGRDDLGVFSISYGTPNSSLTGYFVSDVLTIGGVSVKQTIGVATEAHSGNPAGGIFGIGLPGGESVTSQGKKPYPGYLDTLYKAGLITARGYSIYFDATNAHDTSTGSIVFGAYDSSKYIGNLVSFPLVEPAPDGGMRLDIAAPAVSYSVNGNSKTMNPISPNDVVVMDTGTAMTYIPVGQFNPIATALDAQPDPFGFGLYTVSCNLANNKGGMTFTFAGELSIVVPWSEMVISDSALTNNKCYLGVAPKVASNQGGTYVLGDTFLRSVYIIYNFDLKTISMGQANYKSSSSSRMLMI